MKLSEQSDLEDTKMNSNTVAPGYVKQMISLFSSGYSNDRINGIANGNVSEATFKVPLLHSTRSSFKSEKPRPFHYPVLLVNRSSIPTKPYFNRNYSRNSSGNHSSPEMKNGEEEKLMDDVSSRPDGIPDQSSCESNEINLSSHASQLEDGSGDHKSTTQTEDANKYIKTDSIRAEATNVKNGNYFLQLMVDNDKLLSEKRDKFNSLLGPDIPDDVSGKIRSAIGKANLLKNKKFPQFHGLCKSNMADAADDHFQVTSEDLEGFWDLVMIQVSDVDASFEELDELRKNGWKEDKMSQSENEIQHSSIHLKQVTPTKSRDNVAPAKTSSKKGKTPECSAEKMRLRAAMQAGRRQRKASQNEDEVQIFVAEKS